jgi:hypothetical protein
LSALCVEWHTELTCGGNGIRTPAAVRSVS